MSNADCLFIVVVGFEAYTVCASTKRLFRVPPLLSDLESGFRVVSVNFSEDFELRAVVTTRGKNTIFVLKKSHGSARSVSVWTRTFTRARVRACDVTKQESGFLKTPQVV